MSLLKVNNLQITIAVIISALENRLYGYLQLDGPAFKIELYASIVGNN